MTLSEPLRCQVLRRVQDGSWGASAPTCSTSHSLAQAGQASGSSDLPRLLCAALLEAGLDWHQVSLDEFKQLMQSSLVSSRPNVPLRWTLLMASQGLAVSNLAQPAAVPAPALPPHGAQ